MIAELITFAALFALGAAARLGFLGLNYVEDRIRLKAVTVIFDVIAAGLTVGAFAIIVFFLAGGRVLPYMVLSALTGFCLAAVIK